MIHITCETRSRIALTIAGACLLAAYVAPGYLAPTADAQSAPALHLRSGLAEAAAEQVEDGRRHRAGRRQGRQRLGAESPERHARHRRARGTQSADRRLLPAAARADPHRQERHRDRLVRRDAGARHGRRQPGLRLRRLEHGPQVRPEDRHAGEGTAARARAAAGRRRPRAPIRPSRPRSWRRSGPSTRRRRRWWWAASRRSVSTSRRARCTSPTATSAAA